MNLEGSGIYQIRHIASGKRYIGSAKKIRVRWNGHKRLLRLGVHHSPYLQNAWSKYGESAFAFEVVRECPAEALIQFEQAEIDATAPEYNVCKVAGSTFGRSHSRETRLKIGAKALGRKCMPRNEDYRRRLSEAHKGRTKPAHVMEALQAGRRAQVFTDERRKRMSIAGRQAYSSGKRVREKAESHRYAIGRAFAKLTDEQVREIRKLRAAGTTGRALALQFSSNAGTISEICSGKRYAWVS
jgi:group I intron endonuclease